MTWPLVSCYCSCTSMSLSSLLCALQYKGWMCHRFAGSVLVHLQITCWRLLFVSLPGVPSCLSECGSQWRALWGDDTDPRLCLLLLLYPVYKGRNTGEVWYWGYTTQGLSCPSVVPRVRNCTANKTTGYERAATSRNVYGRRICRSVSQLSTQRQSLSTVMRAKQWTRYHWQAHTYQQQQLQPSELTVFTG